MAWIPVSTLTARTLIAGSLGCRTLLLAALVPLALALVLAPRPAAGQDGGYHVEVRNTPLDQALRAFADATGSALAFDPDLVRGERTTCILRTSDPEKYLACLLADTNLEFFRRASGTYVIGPRLVLPARYGLITGQVREAETDDPLSRAHIVLKGARTGTISSSYGEFVLPDLLPGRYGVSVSHLGYDTWSDSVEVRAGTPTRIGARLTRRVLSVEPVIVEHSATSLFPLEAPSGEVIRGPVATGVSAGSFVDLTAGIHIQGANEGHTEVRLDGHPVYLPRQLLGMIGPFGSLAIASLTEERAGFGAAGGSLLGGVLDFRQELDREPGLDLKATRYALESSAAYHWPGGQRGSTRLQAAARQSVTGNTAPAELQRTLDAWALVDPFLLFAPTGDLSAVRDERVETLFDLDPASPSIRFSDAHLNLEHERPGGSTWTASAFLAGRGIEGDRRRTLAERNLAETSPLLSSVAKHDWNTVTASLGWRTLLGQRSFLQASGRVSRYRYNHAYSLAEFADFPSDLAQVPEGLVGDFRSVPDAGDGNSLDEIQLSVRLDHARNGHAISAGLEATNTSSDFILRLASVADGAVTNIPTQGDSSSVFLTRHRVMSNASAAARIALWAADRWEREAIAVDGSVRLTFLPDRATLYAEPRLRAAWKPSSTLVLALSGGLYRQYVHQFDYSTLNAGELVPSTRFWLPIDESVTPARALHSALDMDWRIRADWILTAGVYAKRIDDAPALRYALPSEVEAGVQSQSGLLGPLEAVHRGVRLQLERAGPRHRSRLRYDGARDRQQSPALFGGKSVHSPWSVPHRLVAEHEVATGSWALRSRLTWERGMRWALRQAYYDYFGSLSEATFGEWDLSNPDAHRLPDRMTLDLGARWEPAGGVILTAEVLNVLDRANALDRRLLGTTAGSALSPEARLLPGRMAVLGLQVRL